MRRDFLVVTFILVAAAFYTQGWLDEYHRNNPAKVASNTIVLCQQGYAKCKSLTVARSE